MRHLRAVFRLVIFIVATVLLYSGWAIGSVFIPNKQYWRQLAFRLWSTVFVKISRMRIEIIGTPPKPPFFLVSNHLSYTDVAAIRAVVTGIFVAKAEIRNWLFGGRMVRDMGNIFIDRGNRRDIPRAGDEIIKKLSEGEGVIVFPEGTSTKGEEVLPFNSSFFQFAAQSDIPVSFVSIGYRTPEGEVPASDAVCWWDDKTFPEHLYRLFMIREYTAILNFGDEPVLNTDRKKLASELHDRVAERFIPVI
jgi:1-acyl-sn-glycerol-3-phosphate acyltransferase